MEQGTERVGEFTLETASSKGPGQECASQLLSLSTVPAVPATPGLSRLVLKRAYIVWIARSMEPATAEPSQHRRLMSSNESMA